MPGAGCPACGTDIEARVRHIIHEMHNEVVLEHLPKNSLGLPDYSAFRPPQAYQGWMEKTQEEFEKWQKFVRPEARNTAAWLQARKDAIAFTVKATWILSRFLEYGSEEWHQLAQIRHRYRQLQ